MGSENFKDEIVSDYLHCDLSDIDSREQPLLSKINAVSPEEILKVVISYYKLDDMKKITDQYSLEFRTLYLFSFNFPYKSTMPLPTRVDTNTARRVAPKMSK